MTFSYVTERLYLLGRPAELIDRARNKLEALREPAAGRRDHATVLADARVRGYVPTNDWQNAFAETFGSFDLDGFDAVWSELEESFEAGVGLDADRYLAQAVWATVRATRPNLMVETGVSRGILTRVTLEAMARNGHGRLFSIDLAPHHIGLEQSRVAVPDRLRANWTYLSGSSKKRLPRLLECLGSIDVFLHDSQHTERNMRFELTRALAHLRPGGVLMSDDIHDNNAWAQVAGERGLVVQEHRKAGMFGLRVRGSQRCVRRGRRGPAADPGGERTPALVSRLRAELAGYLERRGWDRRRSGAHTRPRSPRLSSF